MKKEKKKINWILVFLIISFLLNLYLVYEITFQSYQKDTNNALAAADIWSKDYCNLRGVFSEDEIENNLKAIKPLSNAVIEEYEGKKTLYVSYMKKNRFSQNWADSRFLIEECK